MSKKSSHTEDIERLAKEASEWVASPDGQKEILKTFQLAKTINDKLEEAHRPDPKSLHVPFTM